MGGSLDLCDFRSDGFMKIKTIKYKCWTALQWVDDLKELPTIHDSKQECIYDNTSHYGHPLDDPRKRGIIAECELIVKIKYPLKLTRENVEELDEYENMNGGSPALLVVGDEIWNKKAIKDCKKEFARKKKSLQRLRETT